MTYGVTLQHANGTVEYTVVYEKCKHCHLFIDWEEDGTTIHPDGTTTPGCWLHSSRGDDADEALDGTHNAEPSGLIATLDTWRKFGPPAMLARFVFDGFDPTMPPAEDFIGRALLGSVPWGSIDRNLMGVSA